MPTDRLRRRIDGLLDQSRSASEREDWAASSDLARQALQLDAGRDDARLLLDAGERKLEIGGGTTVPAAIQVATSGDPIRRLWWLRWLSIALPITAVLAISVLTATLEVRAPHLDEVASHGLLGALMVALIVPFSAWVFRWFDRYTETLAAQRDALVVLHEQTARQGAQLRAVNEAGLALVSSRSLPEVLRSVVQGSRDLLRAKSARLEIVDDAFAIAGVTVKATSPGTAAAQPNALRAPISYQGSLIGYLVVDEPDDGKFAAEDQGVLRLFAAHVAAAMFNAQLRDRIAAYAALEERARIGREMHDSFGQVLGYVSTKAQAVEDLVRSARVEQALEQLTELQGAVQSLYTDVREEIFSLRGVDTAGRGLSGNLAAYVRQFERSAGLPAVFEARDDLSDLHLHPGVEAHVTRIVQEALTNVRKHARAHHVWVTISGGRELLEVTVRDDGVGFSPRNDLDHESGFGLRTMQERAVLIGGTLRVDSQPNVGTCVELRLPIAG